MIAPGWLALAAGVVAVVAAVTLSGPAWADDGHQDVTAATPAKKTTLPPHGVIRTLGQPRTLAARPAPTAEAPVADEFDAIPLGNTQIGRGKLVVRGLEAASSQVSRDCSLAEGGNSAAAYRLGRRYLFGMGVTRDKRMGVAWMRAAASRGYGPAMQVAMLVPANLGRMRPWCRPTAGPLHGVTPPPAEIAKLVTDMAPTYGLDPRLVLAVISIESAFHTNAVSPKEAAGLMQLIPDTASRFGVHNVFDPADNIRGGMRYLRWLLAYFEGDVTLAVAGYNAGERAVDRHGGVPPYPETQAYVRLIHGLYPATTHRFDASVTAPSDLVVRQTADAAR